MIFEYYRVKVGSMDKSKPISRFLLKTTGYCLYILENFIKYMTKNSYIQTALSGESLCKASF
jgi:hypothetical protein